MRKRAKVGAAAPMATIPEEEEEDSDDVREEMEEDDERALDEALREAEFFDNVQNAKELSS